MIVGRLLNQGNVNEAGRVCKQFSHFSQDYEIITNMCHLADGTLAVQFLNEKLISLTKVDPKRLNKQDLLTALAEKCIFAKDFGYCILVRFKVAQLLTVQYEELDLRDWFVFGSCILVRFKVAQLLTVQYEELDFRDAYETLQLLLMKGHEKCQLIQEFVQYNRLDPFKVSAVLATHCIKSILDSPGLCDQQVKKFIIDVLNFAYSNPEQQNEYEQTEESERDSPREEGAEPNSYVTPVKLQTSLQSRFSSNKNLSTPQRLDQIMTTPSTPIRDHLSSWSSNPNGTIGSTTTEFIDFISLARTPEEVGEQLLARLTPLIESNNTATCAFEVEILIHSHFTPLIESNNTATYAFEVEILIHSHFCFLVATHVNGVDRVIDIILKRVEFYVKKREFKLLVRLLTGTKEYSRLESLLHILTAHDCFEMMLAKHVVMNEEGKRELKLSLFHFLKTHYPEDAPKMKLLLLRFGMFREYAQLIQDKAMAKLGLISQIKTFSPSLYPLLLEIMERLLDAADNYQKAKSLKHAQKCYQQADLVALQLEQPEIPFINLNLMQVRQLMAYGGVFQHSYVLANAYGLNEKSEWIIPIYNQVIEAGNFEYFSDFTQKISFGDDFFTEIIRKWTNSTARKTAHVQNLKRFLSYIDDFILRYQIATSLGPSFRSVVVEIEKEFPWISERVQS